MSQDSRDCLATVIRRSCECSEYAATKFWRIYNAKISRHSYNCRMNVVRQSRDNLENTCEHLATIWREIKTRRHECHETCLATFVRMKMKLKLHSWEFVRPPRMTSDCHTTVARLSCDSRELYFQN